MDTQLEHFEVSQLSGIQHPKNTDFEYQFFFSDPGGLFFHFGDRKR
jgi:hypothetical protein